MCAQNQVSDKLSALMILVYGDESMDEKKRRVCAVAGIAGTESVWKTLECAWVGRTRGIEFHANDCDSDKGDFAQFPHAENKALYKDLTILLAESGLIGLSSVIDVAAHIDVFGHSYGVENHYYGAFMNVLIGMRIYAESQSDIAEFTFDTRVESEYNSALLYANIRNSNPEWKERIAPKISYETSMNPRIQAADLFARESMKVMDNIIGPVKRPVRKSWITLTDTGRFSVLIADRGSAEEFIQDIAGVERRIGFRKEHYEGWLAFNKRQHSVTTYLEFAELVQKSRRLGVRLPWQGDL